MSYLGRMSEQVAGGIPQFTVVDRLRKAREHAGLEQGDLARMIGLGRATISNYERAAHALRHTFVTRVYASSGHDILTTQQLARHQDPSTTAGYALVADEQRQAAVLGLRGVA